jgi:hypothetical protein
MLLHRHFVDIAATCRTRDISGNLRSDHTDSDSVASVRFRHQTRHHSLPVLLVQPLLLDGRPVH